MPRSNSLRRVEGRSTGAPKRAAIYARVSTEMQASEGESIPAQVDRLHRWARENGYIVVAEYIDEGQSARTSDRKEFARMLQEAKAQPKPYDAILVWKWDRFARNVDDASIFKSLIRRQIGMELNSISDPQMGGAVGTLMERILDVIAEFQSLLTAENVKNTMSFLAEGGRWLGKRPFGYDLQDGKLVPKADEAEAVRWAFDQIAKRQSSMLSIADVFAVGAQFPATLKYKWSQQAIRQILRNPAYLGQVVWNKRSTQVTSMSGVSQKIRSMRDEAEWITVEKAHEPIIDEETWRDAQHVLDEIGAKYTRTPKGAWLFHGLVRCARCDSKFSYYHPNDRTLPKLVCNRYFRMRTDPRSCKPMNWMRPADLKTIVLHAMRALIGGEELDALDIVSPRRQTAKQTTASAATANRQRLQRLLDGYEAGIYSLDEVKERRQAIDAEYARLTAPQQENGAAQDTREAEIALLRERVADVLGLLENREIGIQSKNGLLSLIIDRITVDREANTVSIRWRVGAPEE